MRSHVEKVSHFYADALLKLGKFSITPAKEGFEFAGPVAFKLLLNHTDPWSCSEFLYWSCCLTSPCIYFPGVAIAEAGALILALCALIVTLASTPFVYTGAALMDCCTKPSSEEILHIEVSREILNTEISQNHALAMV